MSRQWHYSLSVKVRQVDVYERIACVSHFSLAHPPFCANRVAGHKSEEALRDRNPILRWYYSIYVLFAYCCAGAECFYILLYVYHFTHNDIVWKLAMYACGPACAMKNIVNLVQMWSAAYAIAERDAENRISKK